MLASNAVLVRIDSGQTTKGTPFFISRTLAPSALPRSVGVQPLTYFSIQPSSARMRLTFTFDRPNRLPIFVDDRYPLGASSSGAAVAPARQSGPVVSYRRSHFGQRGSLPF
jgi:hypothetical protein